MSYSSSCARWSAGQVHRLYHAQAARSVCRRGPHQRDARGQMVGTVKPAEATSELLAEMMVGRKVILQIDKADAHPGEEILHVENLRVMDDRKHMTVDGVSLSCARARSWACRRARQRPNRIDRGADRAPPRGRRARDDFGATRRTPHRDKSSRSARRTCRRPAQAWSGAGVPVRDNLVLCSYYRSPFAEGVELDFPVIEKQAEELVTMFDIRTPSINTSAGSLSGGNQQKVIVARELSRPVKLLIASQPTRGLDVGSIEFIHQRIVEARDKGAAVLLISAELDEIMSLSDRIAVMYKGTFSTRSTPRRRRASNWACSWRVWQRRARMSSATLARPTTSRSALMRMLDRAKMPALALVTAFVLGAVVIWITSGKFGTIFQAYDGLVRGALFKERGLSESLVATVPTFCSAWLWPSASRPACSTSARKANFTSARSAQHSWTGIPRIACDHSPAARVVGGRTRRGDLAGIPGYLKARHRSARSHQHDDDELYCIPLHRVPDQLPVEGQIATAVQTPRVSSAAELWTLRMFPRGCRTRSMRWRSRW